MINVTPVEGDASLFIGNGLMSVTIPESVTSIGSAAFYGCSGLKEITSLNTTPPSVDISAFYGVDSTCVLKVPTSAVEAYKKENAWKYFKNIVGIKYERIANPIVQPLTSPLWIRRLTE